MHTGTEEHRMLYTRLNEAIRYALGCDRNGDALGEKIGLSHAFELLLDLMGDCYKDEEAEVVEDAVELDGMRDVPGEAQDLQEAGATEEEGAREAHVVPVVPEGDEASGEVLSETDQNLADACIYCKSSHIEQHADDQLVCWLDSSLGRAVKPWYVCPRFARREVDAS